MEELRKCPFCGGEAEMFFDVPYASYVECLKCGSRTKICYTKAEAIAAWNRRVTQNIGKKECSVQEEE